MEQNGKKLSGEELINEILEILPFTVEDDISYFCKWDELTGVIASPNPELPSIAESCYVDPKDIFGY